MAVWTNLVKLLTDLKGRAVPGQYFNPTTGQMEAQQGSNGAANVSLAGSNVEGAPGSATQPIHALQLGFWDNATAQFKAWPQLNHFPGIEAYQVLSNGDVAFELGHTGIAATPISGSSTVAITTATTTSIKPSNGYIGTLVNAGAATSGTITVYDNTSATGKIVWSGTLTAGQVLPLGIPCLTGITIVTAAANTLAVSYA